MLSIIVRRIALACILLFAAPAFSQSTTAPPTATTTSIKGPSVSTTRAPTSPAPVPTLSGPPDVLLNVPNLSVGRIELDVDQLKADINLNAQVAGLVSINAGVAIGVQKINLTIADVEAELELIVRLGNLVNIVNRVFESLDLNPLLINTLNNVTEALKPIVGAVDGLIGSVTQSGTTLNFLVDNLGNIVQQVAGTDGNLVSSIVGNYLQNMTATGVVTDLGSGLTQKEFSYSPLNALVDIVFNTAGQVVQAVVQKKTGGGGSSSSVAATTSAAPTGVAR